MVINVRRLVRQLIVFEMIYMILINYMCYVLKLPMYFKYFADIINIVIALYDILHFSNIRNNKNLKLINRLILFSFFSVVIGFFINNYSFFQFLWGARTVLRFIIVFYGVVLSFDYDDALKIITLLNALFIINVFVCLYQFFILGWNQDLLGGTFSNGIAGGNAGLLVLLFFESIYLTELYLNNKVGIIKFLLVIMFCFILAALAELKIFFVIYFIILLLSLLQNHFSYKTILTVIGCVVLFYIGLSILKNLFPIFNNWFNLDRILSSINTTYVDGGRFSLSRGNAINEIYNMFFINSVRHMLFGFGLGGCISSSIVIFNSPFFDSYSYLHYDWFSHSFVYIETGVIGLILFYLFFILCFLFYSKYSRISNPFFKSENSLNYFHIIISFLILLLLTTFYNAFLLTDSAYFAFVLFAIPFVFAKKDYATTIEGNDS